MKPVRSAVCLSLAGAIVTAAAHDAGAVVVARITRHGYIVTDDPDSDVYGNRIPNTTGRDLVQFIGDVTGALSNVPGFHAGTYLAAMQIPQGTGGGLAFYLPIRNDVRGIGQRSSIDSRSEVFDGNRAYGTAFPIDGFVYLNTLYYYTDPRAVNFGRYLICTQEFGHRYGVRPEIPAFPGMTEMPDAGPVDAAMGDVLAADADPTDGASADGESTDAAADVGATDVTPLTDGALTDGAPSDAPSGPPPLARDALLGRGNATSTGAIVNRAHWSYFFSTGGSPMEGNNWMETAPGVFQTMHPTFRFSDLDLYLMGLLPAAMVRPSFLIAEPTMVPRGISRDSAPEYGARTVTIRGQRVPITVEDIIRANGARRPAYPDTPRDLDVVWVLLAGRDDVDDNLANQFDEAIESCTLGYNTSTGDRGHLLYSVPAGSDAGPAPDGPTPVPDVLVLPDVPGSEDASVSDASVGDAVVTADARVPATDAPTTPQARLTTGGCTCDLARASAPTAPRGAFGLCLIALGVCVSARRRSTRTKSDTL